MTKLGPSLCRPGQRQADQAAPGQLLLVLDNCEHLVEACTELAELLLRACPELRILATSREPLGIAGEVTWRVSSLPVPALGVPATVADVQAHAATRLFAERASAARHDFRLTDQLAGDIVAVCRQLDGIPLALELAAARVRVLSVGQIARRLDDPFRLLAGGRGSAPPRHLTLRATLDWSYALLQDPERRLFNRLSVFAGGWTLEAAEAICPERGVEPGDVLELLGHLVDQSLVIADEQAGQVRYRLLETIRQYAAEQLAQASRHQRMHDTAIGSWPKPSGRSSSCSTRCTSSGSRKSSPT